MQGEPRIKHLDELPWIEVSRIAFPDRTASIWEKWVDLTPRFQCFYNKWDPGAMTPRHGHHGDHVVFVLEGEIRMGGKVCTAGSHITLEYGDTFGPWIAGPHGALLYGWMAGGFGHPFAADDAEWQALLASMGAKEVPVPPPPIPAWFPRGNALLNPIEGKK
jgi:hypothetical protein